jgi:hypothetical protein
VLRSHDIPRRGDFIISSDTGDRLSTSSWYHTARGLVDRAGVKTRASAHTFRKTVATVMYEQGVRGHVIDEIMGWAPRTVRDRHYIRIAPKAMRDAILTHYQNDPICPEPRQEPDTRWVTRPLGDELLREVQRLTQLERELGLRTA